MASERSNHKEDKIGSMLFCVNFNQDFSSISVGSKNGYRLFTLTSVDKVEEICYSTEIQDVSIVERLFSSSLMALVSMSYPRKLNVCHFKKKSEICNYSYPNTILSVKLNRIRVVVCLEESLYIHSIRDMKVLHTIRETPRNVSGICSLCPSSENSFLAYPGSSTVGQVQIFDAVNLQSKIMISAHDSPLAALAFNESGTKIATASERGTLVRVFNVADGTKLHELRRGLKRFAAIQSLSFALNSAFLVASSNKETVHIFRLEVQKDAPLNVPEDQPGLMSWMTNVVSSSASYLPAPVTDMFSQDRAFATVTLPFLELRNSCALTMLAKVPYVVVASSEGILYIYSINMIEGGECRLLKQHRLDGSANTTSEPISTSDQTANQPIGASYARAVSGVPESTKLTEAEKLREISSACESPAISSLKLDDDDEYPAM